MMAFIEVTGFILAHCCNYSLISLALYVLQAAPYSNFLQSIVPQCDNLTWQCSLHYRRAVPNPWAFFQQQTGPVAIPITLGFQLTAEYEVSQVLPSKIPAAPQAVQLQQQPSAFTLGQCWMRTGAGHSYGVCFPCSQLQTLPFKAVHWKDATRQEKACTANTAQAGLKKRGWETGIKGGTIKHLILESSSPP